MLNVAIIGVGYIGKIHLETLMKIPGVRVKALVDRNQLLASELAGQYGIPVVAADYRELLGDPEIQVFHNCTPNHLHFEINKTLLEAGKHVISEKPLAISSSEAKELRDLADEKQLITAVNFCYRYYPAVQEAAARVNTGEVGRVHTVMGAYLQDWLLYETDYNWRLDRKLSGPANAVADIGSHWCDLAQFVSGLKIVEVMADLRTIIPVRKKSSDVLTFSRADTANSALEDVKVEVDDYASVLIRFDNGARGAFTVCQLCAGRKCTIDLQVYGCQSSLAWSHEQPSQLWQGHRDRANEVFIENPLLQRESSRRYALLPAGHPMGYHDAEFNLFSDFYRAIRMRSQGAEPTPHWPDFAAGYDEMAILDAILKSNSTQRWVRVER